MKKALLPLVCLAFLVGLSGSVNAKTIKLQNSETENLADIWCWNVTSEKSGFQIKFNISKIPLGKTIENSKLCVYWYTSTDHGLDNDAIFSRVDDQTWDESIMPSEWNSQSLTNTATTENWSSVAVNTWGCLNVTDIVKYDYSLENDNTTIRVRDPDYFFESADGIDDSPLGFGYYMMDELVAAAREYPYDVSKRPYLNITYYDIVDSDADSVPDDQDNCPTTPNADQTDTDADGVGDACDSCPSDPAKIVPGACGCSIADSDSDRDGVADCNDNCPLVANPSQEDADGDGIGDACEVIMITATVDIDPDTLNLKSKGKWITAYLELPEGYNVSDISVSVILLNDAISAELSPTEIGDYDNDGIPDLMVKFDRANVEELIKVPIEIVELTLTGTVAGITFEGTDAIRVIDKGK